jgi:hypothetical protein
VEYEMRFIMKRHLVVLGLAATLATTVVAYAGPFTDFERDLRDACGQYRTALFQSNMGNADATSKALKSLSEKWTTLDATWGKAPPPQYADDAGYAETLTAIESVIAQASQEVAGGDLAKVHVTLEGLRADVGALHDRNGTLPDKGWVALS